MSGAVIATEPCPDCAAEGRKATIRYSETKTGGVSGHCDGCGFQGLRRSPKSVNGLKRRLSGAVKPADESTELPAAAAGFDISKL